MRDGLKNLRINSKERDKKRSTKFMTPLKVKVAGVEQRKKKILKHVIFCMKCDWQSLMWSCCMTADHIRLLPVCYRKQL